MKDKSKPYLINFPKIGDSALGYISLTEKENLPFVPKRIYWTYYTPEAVVRGNHSHYELEQILVAVAGKVIVNIILSTGEELDFVLESPSTGLFIPKKSWRTMKYSHNAVQMCIASLEYDEKDYIRDFEEFKKMYLK
ncbi:MAG: FdtA/QdtA family cupin domain-containing protein [Bacteroidia bacterium]|nr:FdtA/QdtA family cupin domain-containing protein [Bacteroidia bacterium]